MSNIPKGYKQTEVGVIPSDWEVKNLCNISTEIGDGIHATPRYVDSSDYFFVNGNNLVDGKILITDDTKCISKQEYNLLKKRLNSRTVLMSINGTIGNLAFFNNENIVLGKSAAYINLKDEFEKSLIYYLLQHSSIKNYYENELTGTTIRNLSLGSIRVTPIPLPPTKAEQTAIATALSDVDALISRLEELIAKKRNIKQGAMQELLTGKKRLPGFSGEWEEKSLIELADNKKDLFDDGDWIEAEYLTEDGIRLIQTGNIGKGVFLEKENKKYISLKSFDILRCKEIREEDILICRLAEPAGRACIMPNIGEDRIITAVDVSIFRPLQTMADRQYLVNVFSTNDWFNVVNEKCGGSTRTRIARGALGKIKLLIPPLPEQIAIAQILSDMDAEIKQLEQKRDKYRMIKQGMMQELLTGKTRLL